MITGNSISAVNETVIWKVTAVNGNTNNVGVFVTLNLDPGWVIAPGFIASQGTLAGNIWTIGGMTPGQIATADIPVKKITNLLGSPWTFIAVVTGLDTNAGDNTLTDTVTLGECILCPPSAGAIPDPFACICGSSGANDTPCTSGSTSWEYDVASLTNVEMLNYNTVNGNYLVRPIDPFLPWSFQYSIWCDTGGGPLQTSGPALVSGPAQYANYNKFPRLIQEDFNPDDADTFVTLSQIPLAGFQIFAHRNGTLQPQLSFTLVGAVVTPTVAFGPSGGAEFSETYSVLYYAIV